MDACAPLTATSLAYDRRRFLRQIVCQAQVEFSRLESPARVIDSALLTVMGALGVACGFSSWCRSKAERRHVVGRGLDDKTLFAVDRRWDDLMACCFAAADNSPDAGSTQVRILPVGPDLPALSSIPALRVQRYCPRTQWPDREYPDHRCLLAGHAGHFQCPERCYLVRRPCLWESPCRPAGSRR